ncbi:probable polyol transporter 3 isoform X5 [Ricinus communis]|uniref:probable polyol transporter 3 isoform X5 n=1 Tax=Ricinus communis TaxID=3988 RepID=UPI00201AF1EA|nr:probable polyol transporter 3 isoform X5 [Ricinus communis]
MHFWSGLPVMQFSSTLESDKHGNYHPLPDFASSLPSEIDLKPERRNRVWHKDAAEGESLKHKAALGAPAQRKTHINKYAFAGAVLASTNSVLLGYDIGVMSGAVLYIRDDLHITSTQVEILVGCLNVCSLIGSLASVYTAELSPAITRGFLSSLPEVFINVGALLGYVSNYALSGLPNDKNWRLMLGLAAFPAIIVALGVMVMPESPRWLVMKGRFGDAKKVLARTSESEEEAELRLTEMIKAAKDLTHGAASSNWRGQGAWRELLFEPSRPIRRILISAIGVNFFMQASGNDAVMYYTPAVFKDAGIQSRQQLVGVTIIMGIAKTFFVLVSALFLDRFGRRPLLLLGTTGMAVALAALGLGSKYLQQCDIKPLWAIALCIVAVCADVSFFSIGLGPITWVYSSEIFPMRLRAQGTSLAISVNRLVSGIVAMTFLSISRLISFGGMFFALSGILVVGTIFFYFFLPETKGKTLEEIGSLFEDKIPENERHFVS